MFMNPDKYTKLTDQYYFEQREKSDLIYQQPCHSGQSEEPTLRKP
jgi:hypothetical protein